MLATLSTYFLLPSHLYTSKVERYWVKAISTQQCRRRKLLGGTLSMIVLWNSATGGILAGIKGFISKVSTVFHKQYVSSTLWLREDYLKRERKMLKIETAYLTDYLEQNDFSNRKWSFSCECRGRWFQSLLIHHLSKTQLLKFPWLWL